MPSFMGNAPTFVFCCFFQMKRCQLEIEYIFMFTFSKEPIQWKNYLQCCHSPDNSLDNDFNIPQLNIFKISTALHSDETSPLSVFLLLLAQ